MAYFVWVEDADGKVVAERAGEEADWLSLRDAVWLEANAHFIEKASTDHRWSATGRVSVKWGHRDA